MTEEEKEAMNILFHLAHINTYLDLDTKSIHNISNNTIKQWKNASVIVLNLIQKQQEEIEKYKYLYEKALNDLVQADKKTLYKDKMIDEISKNPYNELKVNGILFTGTDIKQYFERKRGVVNE